MPSGVKHPPVKVRITMPRRGVGAVGLPPKWNFFAVYEGACNTEDINYSKGDSWIF
jgi:hypothetical protein